MLLVSNSSPYPGYTKAILTIGYLYSPTYDNSGAEGTLFEYAGYSYGFSRASSSGSIGDLTPQLGYITLVLWHGTQYDLYSLGATRPFYYNGYKFVGGANDRKIIDLYNEWSKLNGKSVEVYLQNP